MKAPFSPDNLEHLTRCPLCNKKYHFSQALILDQEENKATFHLSCDNCRTSTLVFVSIGNLGLMSVGMVTDLEREEAVNLFKNEAISVDQVLEIHEYMKNFKGTAKDLI